MSDPGNTAERMRGHEAWILIRRILAAPSPDVERHHIDAARDWLTRQRTLPDDFLRDGEMLRSVRAVAAGAGDPPESKDQQRGDPQEGDLCTAVRRYLSYIADVRSGRVKHLDRGVVLNYAQDLERHL